MNLHVLASLYLFLGGLFCIVIHPVCRLQVVNKSCAKTGSHVFYLKTKIPQDVASVYYINRDIHNTVS